MARAETPLFILGTLSVKTPGATLKAWWQEAVELRFIEWDSEIEPSRPTMIDLLRKAREAYWDRAHEEAKRPKKKPFPKDFLTASECNEFLRSLPPIPLFGEEP